MPVLLMLGRRQVSPILLAPPPWWEYSTPLLVDIAHPTSPQPTAVPPMTSVIGEVPQLHSWQKCWDESAPWQWGHIPLMETDNHELSLRCFLHHQHTVLTIPLACEDKLTCYSVKPYLVNFTRHSPYNFWVNSPDQWVIFTSTRLFHLGIWVHLKQVNYTLLVIDSLGVIIHGHVQKQKLLPTRFEPSTFWGYLNHY